VNFPDVNWPLRDRLVSRPLWSARSAAAFLDLKYSQVMAKIQSGELLWAFNIGLGRHAEVRIFSACVVELKLGEIAKIGPTRKLYLKRVIDLILPQRDVRSTELKRLLSIEQQHVYRLAEKYFVVTRKPKQADGPHSFTVFSRASIAKFLAARRIL
jgi:hypothetical protein